jgi:RNA polymerase sigma-70 factor (ECF subfamily)
MAVLDPRDEYGYAEPLAYRRRPGPRFEDLLRQYRTDLQSFVARRVADPSLVDDIVQDTLLRAFRARNVFDRTKPLWPWLATIARNTMSNALRGERSRRRHIEGGVDWRSVETHADGRFAIDPERRYASKEQGAAIAAALDALDDRQRRMLLLRAAEGLAYEDIARIEGLSIDAVKSLLKRARRSFRDSYKRLGLDDASAALPLFGRIGTALRLRYARLRARTEYAMCAARCATGLDSFVQVLGAASVAGALLLSVFASANGGGSRTANVDGKLAPVSSLARMAQPRAYAAAQRPSASLIHQTVSASPAGARTAITLGGRVDKSRADRRTVRVGVEYQVPGQDRGEDIWIDVPCGPASTCDAIDGAAALVARRPG